MQMYGELLEKTSVLGVVLRVVFAFAADCMA